MNIVMLNLVYLYQHCCRGSADGSSPWKLQATVTTDRHSHCQTMLTFRNTVYDYETCSTTYDLSLLLMLRCQPNLSTWTLNTRCRIVTHCYISPALTDLMIGCSCRYSLLRHSKERQKVDGLNNLNYSPLVVRRPLYTNITVSLSRKLAPVADYWRRNSWTAKTPGNQSPLGHQPYLTSCSTA